MYPQKGGFIRFVCVRTAAAVDKINKTADCSLSRLEGKQGKFLLLFPRNEVNKYPVTKNKSIYHARNVHRWKSLGETSTFHCFTNPRRDKSVYFWSWDTYLLEMFYFRDIRFM